MSLHNEVEFENDICDHLAGHGWLYAEKDAANYCRNFNVYTPDVLGWVQETDPDAWQTLTKSHGSSAQITLIRRLRDSLDQSGTLHVIRNGFDVLGLRKPLRMAQFKPALAMNPDIVRRYAANRLRVVRQVHYSLHNENSLDLVLFLNGVPVATVEIKTDNTQSIDDAVRQYKEDRNPHPKGQAAEPLLSFLSGALVHFAGISSRVQMTTRLAGLRTEFLPFDLGDNGAAGNPINPDGYRTAYLWERVWQRDSLLEILGRYMVAEKDERKQVAKIIFPRYHQLDATRKLQQAVLAEGAGQKYLIQHSAGSGKTNSIAWSAHFLADLHNADDQKVFDTVVVVSDRRVIDGQLQDAIYGFERTAGVVATIKDDQYQILLVANKFQTGFDQPLLCAMYVDKRLAGIQAVQTLSRLNRCYPGKETYVLDFVNEPDEILVAFKTYFTTAELSDVTDPAIILKLRTKLDALGYYDEHEIDRVVNVVLNPKSKQKQLEAAISPVADRLLKKYAAAKAAHGEAVENKDKRATKAAKDAMDALVLFRTDMATYLRAYTFLSQIFDYANTDFEKRSIFFKCLVRLLKFGRERESVDLSEVVLTHHKLSNRGQRDLPLSDKETPKLNPVTEIGSGEIRERQMALLSEIVDQLNSLFGSDTTDGDQLSYANALVEKTLESEILQKQAANNSKEQFANSPDLTSEILTAVMDSMEAQTELSTRALNSEEIRNGLKRILLNQLGLYEKLKSRAANA